MCTTGLTLRLDGAWFPASLRNWLLVDRDRIFVGEPEIEN